MEKVKTYFEGIEPFGSIDKMGETEIVESIGKIMDEAHKSSEDVHKFAHSIDVPCVSVDIISLKIHRIWNVYPVLALYERRLNYKENLAKQVKNYRFQLGDITKYIISLDDEECELQYTQDFPLHVFNYITGIKTIGEITFGCRIYSEEDYKKLKHILTFTEGTVTDDIIQLLTPEFVADFLKKNREFFQNLKKEAIVSTLYYPLLYKLLDSGKVSKESFCETGVNHYLVREHIKQLILNMDNSNQ